MPQRFGRLGCLGWATRLTHRRQREKRAGLPDHRKASRYVRWIEWFVHRMSWSDRWVQRIHTEPRRGIPKIPNESVSHRLAKTDVSRVRLLSNLCREIIESDDSTKNRMEWFEFMISHEKIKRKRKSKNQRHFYEIMKLCLSTLLETIKTKPMFDVLVSRESNIGSFMQATPLRNLKECIPRRKRGWMMLVKRFVLPSPAAWESRL